MNPYIYILGTILFTVYGQIILKWRINKLQVVVPEGIIQKIQLYIQLFFDPYLLSGLFAAFVASIFWMAAMTKFELTKAYPFMSISPALVFVIGVAFMGEAFSWGKVIGLLLVISGTIVTVKF
jgi:multidrug transporter EmrE-like cation transporter